MTVVHAGRKRGEKRAQGDADAHWQGIQEVAPARITFPREDHPDEPLCLQVALIRDLRRGVAARLTEETEDLRQWDSDLPLDERVWWLEDRQTAKGGRLFSHTGTLLVRLFGERRFSLPDERFSFKRQLALQEDLC